MISIMFHSTGLNDLPWRSSHVSEPLDIMKEKLEVIREEGYRTLFMSEAAKHRKDRRDRLVHINLDDGYLDNWVHVFPLLERYELKATIFVTAEFVDPRDIVRERQDLIEREHHAPGCCAGFLSYREMREMEGSGLIEIQSHALTHTWYFKGPEIVDFWHPGAATEPMGPVWMLWNRYPGSKPFYLAEAERLEERIPYGTPIYEHGKSLETTRYFPGEPDLEERLIDMARSGGREFFEREGWRREFHKAVSVYRDGREPAGRYESTDEREARIRTELRESKRMIEEGLGHEIEGICWPGGGLTERVVEMAKRAGYSHFTLPSAWRKKNGGYLEEMIPRIGSLPRVTLKGMDLGYPTRNDFKYHLRRQNGYRTAAFIEYAGKLRKLLSGGRG